MSDYSSNKIVRKVFIVEGYRGWWSTFKGLFFPNSVLKWSLWVKNNGDKNHIFSGSCTRMLRITEARHLVVISVSYMYYFVGVILHRSGYADCWFDRNRYRKRVGWYHKLNTSKIFALAISVEMQLGFCQNFAFENFLSVQCFFHIKLRDIYFLWNMSSKCFFGVLTPLPNTTTYIIKSLYVSKLFYEGDLDVGLLWLAIKRLGEVYWTYIDSIMEDSLVSYDWHTRPRVPFPIRDCWAFKLSGSNVVTRCVHLFPAADVSPSGLEMWMPKNAWLQVEICARKLKLIRTANEQGTNSNPTPINGRGSPSPQADAGQRVNGWKYCRTLMRGKRIRTPSYDWYCWSTWIHTYRQFQTSSRCRTDGLAWWDKIIPWISNWQRLKTPV